MNSKTTPEKCLIIMLPFLISMGRNANADFTFGEPTNLGPIVNSSSSEWPPSISADGLSLYFCSNRPGGYGHRDLWVTSRSTKDNEWGTPENLGPTVNSSAKEAFPSISADGSTLYFASSRAGGQGRGDIWQVSIIPIVDFNADGIVDSVDMCIMVDYWGTDAANGVFTANIKGYTYAITYDRSDWGVDRTSQP